MLSLFGSLPSYPSWPPRSAGDQEDQAVYNLIYALIYVPDSKSPSKLPSAVPDVRTGGEGEVYVVVEIAERGAAL